MQGQVYKIHSDFYYVKPIGGNGVILTCKLREVLKKQKIKIKVGDFVEIENDSAIIGLLERKNTLPRPNVSNLDLVVVVSSLLEPAVDYIQLDRYLTFLKFHKIPVLLCFNKDDLLDKNSFEKVQKEILSIYKPLGYDIVFTSALLKSGLGDFKELIKGKTIVFLGLSGVGKSSILNALSKKILRVGSVSQKNKRGTHTTRHCEIIEFEGIKIMDTPGFSRLTFDFILPKDLGDLFDEIKNLKSLCKYSDCLHTDEDEDCAVIKNLNKIPISRYQSYLSFLKEAKEFKQKVTNESQKEEDFVKKHLDKNFVKISSKKRSLSRKKIKQNTRNIHYSEESDD